MTQMIVAHRSSPEGDVPSSPSTPALPAPQQTPKPADQAEAADFLRLYYAESPAVPSLYTRLRQVRAEIDDTGTYRHTPEELAFGARVAWRNAARCIGRLYWRSLQVRDHRDVRDPASVAASAFGHLRAANNQGRIRPVITVFAPESPDRPAPRIWNEQLIRYAGYRQPDGSVIGDPRYVEFTELALRLGWKGGKRTAFDVLPLLISEGTGRPQLFDLPRDTVHEVTITHPEHDWFAELGLRWHAVPAISNMCLEIGGICYPAAPFNGWYMGTEIGARNFADADRYDMLPEVGRRLGYDVTNDRSLWRDRALVELNIAVLHSFDAAKATITDHHTESQRFLTHLEKEEQNGRKVPADWSWIVPPISGAATPVFHRYYDETELTPLFVHHDDALARGLGTAAVGERSAFSGCPVAHLSGVPSAGSFDSTSGGLTIGVPAAAATAGAALAASAAAASAAAAASTAAATAASAASAAASTAAAAVGRGAEAPIGRCPMDGTNGVSTNHAAVTGASGAVRANRDANGLAIRRPSADARGELAEVIRARRWRLKVSTLRRPPGTSAGITGTHVLTGAGATVEADPRR